MSDSVPELFKAKKRKKQKISIRDYYDQIDSKTYRCLTCDKKLRAMNTSNLILHLSKRHEPEYEGFVRLRDREAEAKRKAVAAADAITQSSYVQEEEDGDVQEDWPPVTEYEEQQEEEQEDDDDVVTDEVETEEEGDPAPDTSSDVQLDTSTTVDPLKMFFDTMYATVAVMPREDILHVRRRIFDIIAEVEEQHHYRRLEALQVPPE